MREGLPLCKDFLGVLTRPEDLLHILDRDGPRVRLVKLVERVPVFEKSGGKRRTEEE